MAVMLGTTIPMWLKPRVSDMIFSRVVPYKNSVSKMNMIVVVFFISSRSVF